MAITEQLGTDTTPAEAEATDGRSFFSLSELKLGLQGLSRSERVETVKRELDAWLPHGDNEALRRHNEAMTDFLGSHARQGAMDPARRDSFILVERLKEFCGEVIERGDFAL